MSEKTSKKLLWVVLDERGAPEHVASTAQECHDHINYAIDVCGDPDAGEWVVRAFESATGPTHEPQPASKELVERLRWTWADHGSGYNSDYTADLMAAADEIERLRNRVDSLTIEIENTNANLAKAIRAGNEPRAVGAFERAREALPEFIQQDDYLLAHGASLMSEDSHEILHVDTLRKIVDAVATLPPGVTIDDRLLRLPAGRWSIDIAFHRGEPEHVLSFVAKRLDTFESCECFSIGAAVQWLEGRLGPTKIPGAS